MHTSNGYYINEGLPACVGVQNNLSFNLVWTKGHLDPR